MIFTEIKTIDVYKLSGFNVVQKNEFKRLESITNLTPLDLIELHSLYSDSIADDITTNIFDSVFKINYFICSHLSSIEDYFEKNLLKKDYVNNVVSHLISEKRNSLFNITDDLKQLEEKLTFDSSTEYSYLDEVIETDFEEDLYSQLDKQIDLKYCLENKINDYLKDDTEIKEKNFNSLIHYVQDDSAERRNTEFLYLLYSNDLFDKVISYTDSTTTISFDVFELF